MVYVNKRHIVFINVCHSLFLQILRIMKQMIAKHNISDIPTLAPIFYSGLLSASNRKWSALYLIITVVKKLILSQCSPKRKNLLSPLS